MSDQSDEGQKNMSTENTNLPQFTNEPVPKGEQVNTLPDTDRSVDEVRTSWAESGDYKQ